MLKWVVENFIVLDGKVRPIWYVWAGGSLVCLWLFFWWSVGLLPSTAFGGGFAKAEDVATIQVQLLENSIIEHRSKQCSATSAQVRQFYAKMLQDGMRKYEDLSGQKFQLPSCGDLVGSDG